MLPPIAFPTQAQNAGSLSRTMQQPRPQESATPVGRAQTEAPAADPSMSRMLPVTGKTDAEGNVRTNREMPRTKECQTCKNRKYQDGSDDPGVSFKTAAKIDPDAAPSVVRGHEQEHVTREQAKAKREGRRVISQTVTLHTAVCPECGRVYVSGGTTRTVTGSDPDAQTDSQTQNPDSSENPSRGGFSVWV